MAVIRSGTVPEDANRFPGDARMLTTPGDRLSQERQRMQTPEATYICDACGEEIVIPIDPSAGESQEYVEDCPVCCRPSVIHVEFDPNGECHLWAEAE